MRGVGGYVRATITHRTNQHNPAPTGETSRIQRDKQPRDQSDPRHDGELNGLVDRERDTTDVYVALNENNTPTSQERPKRNAPGSMPKAQSKLGFIDAVHCNSGRDFARVCGSIISSESASFRVKKR